MEYEVLQTEFEMLKDGKYDLKVYLCVLDVDHPFHKPIMYTYARNALNCNLKKGDCVHVFPMVEYVFVNTSNITTV